MGANGVVTICETLILKKDGGAVLEGLKFLRGGAAPSISYPAG